MTIELNLQSQLMQTPKLDTSHHIFEKSANTANCNHLREIFDLSHWNLKRQFETHSENPMGVVKNIDT